MKYYILKGSFVDGYFGDKEKGHWERINLISFIYNYLIGKEVIGSIRDLDGKLFVAKTETMGVDKIDWDNLQDKIKKETKANNKEQKSSKIIPENGGLKF